MSISNTLQEAPIRKVERIEPAEFYREIAVQVEGGVQGIVTTGPSGAPNDHRWNTQGAEPGEWMAQAAKDRKPAYLTMAAFNPETVQRFKGRSGGNVQALGGYWIDVESSEEKGGYAGAEAVNRAVGTFVKKTGLSPNFIVLTGSGGMHLHYILTKSVTVEQWKPGAQALVRLAAGAGFRIDAQCTTDPARIMRAPGSVHQKTEAIVSAARWRQERYELAEFQKLVGCEPGTVAPRARMGINGDVLADDSPRYSYKHAAKQCAAMRRAVDADGASAPYPVWLLAAKTADLSLEGREYAHQISQGHHDYDEAATDAKLDSLTGGPANCDAWATAYGAGGPCEACEYRGKIKNPAVQLGAVVETDPPGSAEGSGKPTLAPEWVAQLNQRFAKVRIGGGMRVADFRTPQVTARGVIYGLSFLDEAGFRSMFKGQFAPIESPRDRPVALADAWLAHLARRQYEGAAFSPSQQLPHNVLNLWQGFALEPVEGDVEPWMQVLRALAPDENERRYVMRWIAWKVQNPGAVPDTLLIFKGTKGTGKNSLFDPLMTLFGRHAMLVDDPELIAGRFTWHLIDKVFAVLDEAVFIQDPRQADRIKSRVTAKTMLYEQKGMDPVQGVNYCAYAMLTNHEQVWQATIDERRAVVIEVGESLRGNLEFWTRYHAWVNGTGPAALLHYLQRVDLTDFNPRQIPKGEALRKQIEMTALRNPAVAWWHRCLTEGAVRWRDGLVSLKHDAETEIDRAHLRISYEESAAARARSSSDWANVSKQIKAWAGPAGIREVRVRAEKARARMDILPSLDELRRAFTAATQIRIDD